MENRRYHVSLYVLVPLIFTGISVLAVMGTYYICARDAALKAQEVWPVQLWGFAIGALTLTCSSIIVWLILGPVEKFAKEAGSLSILPAARVEAKSSGPSDDMDYLTEVFEQVTQFLSKVEASELFPGVIGQSETIRGLLKQILKVAPTDSTVLITGESGTGKELFSACIYEQSLRKGKPFIKLNCAAIPEGLLESELFGHEKGAFTGAASRKLGKFELADGGTVLLDEIADMPLPLQAKLLRVLQEREFERVGGSHTVKVDVRLIAATNRKLLKMVKEGQFREDLYYRLNVVSLHIPPLRDRKEDIPLLADFFLERAPKPARLSPESLQALLAYAWPGNVRELKNMLDRAAVMAEDGIIEPFHYCSVGPRETQPLSSAEQAPAPPESSSIDDRLNRMEKGLIVDALMKAGGVQSRAARLLGINQRSLWHRIKKHGIDIASLKVLQEL